MTLENHDRNSLIKNLLETAYNQYNTIDFIELDPISIPHQFSNREDIEIAGFMAATIAWGNRKSILTNANRLMNMMGNKPYDFVMSANEKQLQQVNTFVHRTFNGDDCTYFVHSLRNIYKNHGGLNVVFENSFQKHSDIYQSLIYFRNIFLEIEGLERTHKHISNVSKNSTAKRLNMFLRWMVRHDNKGVDFGLWTKIPTSALYLPLDVHTGNVARKLGLLTRTQDDWKAVAEITSVLRTFDATDPIKYDFALFGMGVYNNFDLKF